MTLLSSTAAYGNIQLVAVMAACTTDGRIGFTIMLILVQVGVANVLVHPGGNVAEPGRSCHHVMGIEK